MATRNMTLAMSLQADASKFVSGLTNAQSGVRKFTGGVKREFDALKGALSSVEGRVASLGVSVGAVATIAQSARLDKTLTQIGQTAGVSSADVALLRKELFRMAKESGQNVEDLQQGFNNAVQSGLNFKEALPVIDATNRAMAVTGVRATQLTDALTVASTAFKIDLSKAGAAEKLLDEMTVAARLGNAELESLSNIVSRVGVNAATAGMDFKQTMAFVEGLSLIEKQPERLGTLVDSTLRLFTNQNYMREAAKATDVKFFNPDESIRNPQATLADLKKQYDKLGTDKKRALFMQAAFGKADLDTIKGMRSLFDRNILGKISAFEAPLERATGVLKKDMEDAINNSVDQVGRLSAALREAADGFSKPINDTIANMIKATMDSKAAGGMGLDGKDMILGGGAALLGGLGLARYGGKAVGALAGRYGGTAVGLAEGKALEAAAGVTPVYVVNMPGGGMAGPMGTAAGVAGDVAAGVGGGLLARLAGMLSVPLLAKAGLATAAAGAVGYGVYKATEGTAIGDAIGNTIKQVLGTSDVGGTIYIKGNVPPGTSVNAIPNNRNTRFNVDSGLTMMGWR